MGQRRHGSAIERIGGLPGKVVLSHVTGTCPVEQVNLSPISAEPNLPGVGSMGGSEFTVVASRVAWRGQTRTG